MGHGCWSNLLGPEPRRRRSLQGPTCAWDSEMTCDGRGKEEDFPCLCSGHVTAQRGGGLSPGWISCVHVCGVKPLRHRVPLVSDPEAVYFSLLK